MMEIRYDNKGYFAVCSFEERNELKNLGWKWSSIRGRWETSDHNLCKPLLKYATGEAFERLSGILAVEDSMISASFASDTDTYFWKPDGLSYLPFQKAGIEYMLAKNNVLLADEQGLGKTISLLGLISNTPGTENVLYITRASLIYNIVREAKKWSRPYHTVGMVQTKRVSLNDGSPRTKAAYFFPSTNIVVINYDMLQTYHKEIRDRGVWDVVICDEAQDVRNKKTTASQEIFGSRKVSKILSKKFIFSTGTPMDGHPISLWNFIEKCDPHGLGENYKHFVYRYCGGHETPFGLFKDGCTHATELQNKLRSTFMIRRMKLDVLKDLPPKVKKIIELPPEGLKKIVKKELAIFEKNLERLTSANKEIKYDEEVFADVSLSVLTDFVRNAKETKLEDIEIEDYMKLHFEAMGAAREEVGIGKAGMVATYVKDILDAGSKVVIMAVHKAVVKELLVHFPNAAVITGAVTSKKKRDEEVQRFQTDPNCRVFIGNIESAGAGITLTAADNLVFAELDWDPSEMAQAEDRIHRISQTSTAFIHYLVVRGSLEAAVVEALLIKQDANNKVLDKTQEIGV